MGKKKKSEAKKLPLPVRPTRHQVRQGAYLRREVHHWVEAPREVKMAITDVIARVEITGLMTDALAPYRIDPVEIKPIYMIPVYEDDVPTS